MKGLSETLVNNFFFKKIKFNYIYLLIYIDARKQENEGAVGEASHYFFLKKINN
jgi:hypothetical protein